MSKNRRNKTYTIVTLEREDLDINGFDSSKFSDEQMANLAGKMQRYFDDTFQDALFECCREIGIMG